MDPKRKKLLMYGGGAVALAVVAYIVLKNRGSGGGDNPNAATTFASLGPNLSGASGSFQPAASGGGGAGVDDAAQQLVTQPDLIAGGWVGGWGGGSGIGAGPGPQGDPHPIIRTVREIIGALPHDIRGTPVDPLPLPEGGGRIFPVLPPQQTVTPVGYGAGSPIGTRTILGALPRDIGRGATFGRE